MICKRLLLVVLAFGVGLTGCGVGGGHGSNQAFTAKYKPTKDITPYPNDFYIGGDGTVAPPGAYDPASATDSNADFSSPEQAVSALDGFSTVAPVNVYFSDAVNASSLKLYGKSPTPTVYVLDVTDPNAVTRVTSFDLGVSPALSADQRVVEITPTAPLDPESKYGFIVTTGVEDVDGDAVQASDTFQTIKDAIANQKTLSDSKLERIKKTVEPVMQAAKGQGLKPSDVAVAWTMTTQSVGASLEAIANAASQQSSAVADTGLTTKDVLDPNNQDPSVAGSADVYAGYVTIPYYLDPNAPLTGFWHTAAGEFTTANTPMPEASAQVKVPVIVTIPNASAKPGTGWPVALFQHGINGNRTEVLAVAEALANAGYAAVSIDLPLHGVTDTSSRFYRNQLFSGTSHKSLMVDERTFDLDVENNATGADGGDGKIDPSGAHFLNPSH
ncbi:MAG TPA: Ig-like domain-containing protein, partial [Gammaproteobacteria bacterium]|nr:Ig-like domain-containing protein [Gammaproteobacteria bacterium]